jgi:Predicted metal-binding protein
MLVINRVIIVHYLRFRKGEFMKVGLIRCQQTEDMCPGTTDFKVMRNKKAAFEGIEDDIEIVGFVSCGGCPGKKAVTRAAEMVKRGADTIMLCSCITWGNPNNLSLVAVLRNAMT